MNITDVLAELNTIFQEMVDDPSVILERKTTAADVDEWDSLNHITFVISIEKHFKVKFTRSEIASWANVGDMCDAIYSRINKEKA